MNHLYSEDIAKSPRIPRLIEHLYAKMPVVEADRAVLLTESYKETEVSRSSSGAPRHLIISAAISRSSSVRTS